jgi:hypothetical protein
MDGVCAAIYAIVIIFAPFKVIGQSFHPSGQGVNRQDVLFKRLPFFLEMSTLDY